MLTCLPETSTSGKWSSSASSGNVPQQTDHSIVLGTSDLSQQCLGSVTQEAQRMVRRFESRRDPLRSWRLTDKDSSNREKRPQHEAAVEEMLERTDRPAGQLTRGCRGQQAPGEGVGDRTVCTAIEAELTQRGFDLDLPEL